MTEDERLTDQVLDFFVYIPIGLALEARDLIPKLADRGRGQVALTRLAGKMASARGQSEVRRMLDQVIDAVGTALAGDEGDPRTTDDEIVDLTHESTLLPIDNYDALTAPQLLPFLSPLSGDELNAVLQYEQAHRSRATIINRIRQLQG